jgi:hypothetical protein
VVDHQVGCHAEQVGPRVRHLEAGLQRGDLQVELLGQVVRRDGTAQPRRHEGAQVALVFLENVQQRQVSHRYGPSGERRVAGRRPLSEAQSRVIAN